MIFSKGHEESMQTIVEALNHFSKVTGLVANTDKSSIFIARVSDVVKERLLEMTSYVEGEFPIRYLGLQLSPKKWSKIECNKLCQKIIERIISVSNRHLSYAGKLQVITSILFSIHNFWGAVFILPQSVVKEINGKCREYLWDGTEGKKKTSLVAWDNICRPKQQGGSSIKSCKHWNVASVGKHIWLLMEKKRYFVGKMGE
ncbi:hypothetical protein MTR67_000141 [Solanum verrucosum]|uniref:Reverse transcriptase n=1 Tax=Solanum verrucosum TaxID=315347 RepID=A0AAF0T691_SOLVR|nr:hypothetical protein MTR67_000141 [Solanum verrucosum]